MIKIGLIIPLEYLVKMADLRDAGLEYTDEDLSRRCIGSYILCHRHYLTGNIIRVYSGWCPEPIRRQNYEWKALPPEFKTHSDEVIFNNPSMTYPFDFTLEDHMLSEVASVFHHPNDHFSLFLNALTYVWKRWQLKDYPVLVLRDRNGNEIVANHLFAF